MKKKIIKLPGRPEGKVTIITGGACRMGAAHARTLVEEGAKVAITDLFKKEGSAFILIPIVGETPEVLKEASKVIPMKRPARTDEGTNLALPANTNNDKKYFTFESKHYYAVHNATDFIGLMIFTVDGVAMPEYQFPELWMYYRHQKDFLVVKDHKSSK